MKILVADDEAILRKLIRRILDAAGFGVLLAADGDEAVSAFAEAREEIRLVVLDVAMPPNGGADTLRRILEHRDDVAVVVMSGATLEPDFQEMLDRRKAVFLAKPFAPDAFLRAVHAALGDSAP